MFFDLKILSPQCKGIFSYAWIAATRGVKQIKRNEILQINIVKMSEQVMEFIIRESNQPTRRFSLRLSAILINGITKLFREQALMLEANIINFISFVHTPSGLMASITVEPEIRIFRTPTTPVTKVKSKKIKKQPETETPTITELEIQDIVTKEPVGIVDLKDLEAIAVLEPARVDDISIREEMPRNVSREMEYEGLGPLGAQQILEEEDEFLKALYKPISEKPFEEESTKKTTEKPRFKRKKDSESTPSEEQPPVKIQVTAQIHAPAETEAEIVQAEREKEIAVPRIEILPEEPIVPMEIEVPVGPVEEIHVVRDMPKEQDIEAVTVSSLKEMAEVIGIPKQRDIKVVTTKRLATKVTKQVPFLLHLQPKRVVRIDRNQDGVFELFIEKILILNKKKTTKCNAAPAYRELEPRRDTEQLIQQIDKARQTKSSISVGDAPSIMRHGSSIETPVGSIGHLSGTPQFIDVPSHESLVPQETPLGKTIEEIFPPAANGVQSMRKEIVDVIPAEIPVEEPMEERAKLPTPEDIRKELFPVEEIPTEVPRDIPSLDEIIQIVVGEEIPVAEAEKTVEEEVLLVEKETRREKYFEEVDDLELAKMKKKRQNTILQILKKHDPSMGEMSIEYLCPKPLNKKNIAATFSDLLVLCKSGYVNLMSEEETCQLRSITKGPKFID